MKAKKLKNFMKNQQGAVIWAIQLIYIYKVIHHRRNSLM